MTPRKSSMPKSAESAKSTKTPKTYRLSEAKIAAVREILGAPTATAAIEAALDMVVFRKELIEGTRDMRGVEIADYD